VEKLKQVDLPNGGVPWYNPDHKRFPAEMLRQTLVTFTEKFGQFVDYVIQLSKTKSTVVVESVVPNTGRDELMIRGLKMLAESQTSLISNIIDRTVKSKAHPPPSYNLATVLEGIRIRGLCVELVSRSRKITSESDYFSG
jgi:hypothetical protein